MSFRNDLSLALASLKGLSSNTPSPITLHNAAGMTLKIDFTVVDRAAEVAAARGVPSAQIALAWLLHKPGVTAPIVGATKVEHLEDALSAEQLSLATDEIARLEEPYLPHVISGH